MRTSDSNVRPVRAGPATACSSTRRFTLIAAAALCCIACEPDVTQPGRTGGGTTGTACGSPCITGLSPTTALVGGSDLTLTVTGTGFMGGHHFRTWVLWVSQGGATTALYTSVESSTKLTTLVPATLLASEGVARVLVSNYDPMGDGPGLESNSLEFRISKPAVPPPPALTFTGFTSTGSMSIPRTWHSATLLHDGSVLIAGGWGETDLAPGAEIFDPGHGAFAPTGAPLVPRAGATATALADGRVLMVGGFDGPLLQTASAEIYDPAGRTFRAVGSMAQPRAQHRATLLPDGRVLITGGTGGESGAALSSAEIFDPVSERFSRTGSMLSERARHTATLLPSGAVLIVGGFNGHEPDAPDDPPWDPLIIEAFDPLTGRFSRAGTDTTTRSGHGAMLLWDEQVLLVGGVWDLQNRHEQPPAPLHTELFDPQTGRVASGGPIRFSQSFFSFTELSDRQVLVAGGLDQDGTVARASIIDAATQSVTATGGMHAPRWGHTATRLLDGRVLVTGGNDGQGTAYSSAEIFQ